MLLLIGINYALGRPTWQSSTEFKGKSSHAVDGYKNPTGFFTTCILTRENYYEPWWMVDLGEEIYVKEVRITNGIPKGGYPAKLSNFNARVGPENSNGGKTNPKCAPTHRSLVGHGATHVILCTSFILGRYLTIVINGLRGTLEFCEVQAYGFKRKFNMYYCIL